MSPKPAIALAAALLAVLLGAVGVAVLTAGDSGPGAGRPPSQGASRPASDRAPEPTASPVTTGAAHGGGEQRHLRSGVYLARVADLSQGHEHSTVELKISGEGAVAHVAGTGIAQTECSQGAPDTAGFGMVFLTDELRATDPRPGRGRFGASDGTDVRVTGSAVSGDTISGTLTVGLWDHCTASVDFTAHRQADGAETVADRVRLVGS